MRNLQRRITINRWLQLLLALQQIPSFWCYSEQQQDSSIQNRFNIRGRSWNRTDNTTNVVLEQKLNETTAVLDDHRSLQSQYYWETSSLGYLNYDVTMGNPMRGLSGVPDMGHPSRWPETLPSSLHHYKMPWNSIMNDDPDRVGADTAFNWTIFDTALQIAAQFRSHVIIRFYLHYPGYPLSLPRHLVNNVKTVWYNNEVVPVYSDPNLLRAMQQFIDHFSRRYDGDTRLFVIQAGLLGMWGEWHAGDCTYNWQPCLPTSAQDSILKWYTQYFHKTKIQFRYPDYMKAYQGGYGFHDDSFTFETVSGPANGGEQHEHFFYNKSVIAGTNTFYKRGIMGGEVRPENSHVFAPYYAAGSPWHQDFMLCASLTHTTYMDWSKGFVNDGVINDELKNAQYANVRLGYNFIIQKISAKQSTTNPNNIDIDATIQQVGLAPFYYPLFLDVYCNNENGQSIVVDDKWVSGDLSDFGNTVTVNLNGIPATATCLNTLRFQLGSPNLYSDRPILWAQGNNGRVEVSIPLPASLLFKTESNLDQQQPVKKKRVRRRGPIPFTPEASDDSIVGRCFLICAQTVCPNGNLMGDPIRGISDNDSWTIGTTGNMVSIRCDINANVASSFPDRINFGWPAFGHIETKVPYIMAGHIGKTVFPVDYLKEPGHKTFSVTAYNGYNWLGTRALDFDILP